jgi:hypothetical protein
MGKWATGECATCRRVDKHWPTGVMRKTVLRGYYTRLVRFPPAWRPGWLSSTCVAASCLALVSADTCDGQVRHLGSVVRVQRQRFLLAVVPGGDAYALSVTGAAANTAPLHKTTCTGVTQVCPQNASLLLDRPVRTRSSFARCRRHRCRWYTCSCKAQSCLSSGAGHCSRRAAESRCCCAREAGS